MLSAAAAVAITLGICLVILIVGFALVFWYQKHYIHLVSRQRDAAEKTLDTYPKKWRAIIRPVGFGHEEVAASFGKFSACLGGYLSDWISLETPIECETRITTLLFTDPPWERIEMAGDRDLRFFRNPHHYTPAEIVSYLNTKVPKESQWTSHNDRRSILKHILASIIFTAVSLDGNPHHSLLPYSPCDIVNLDTFKILTEGKFWSSTFVSYISGYGFRFADTARDGFLEQLSSVPDAGGVACATFIHKFADELLGPYYKSTSPEQLEKRRAGFREVLHAAQVFGVRAIATDRLTLKPDWGAREERKIALFPGLKEIENNQGTGGFDHVQDIVKPELTWSKH